LEDRDHTILSQCSSVMKGHTKAVRCVRLIRRDDGTITAISGSYDYTLVEWNVQDGSLIRLIYEHSSTVILLQYQQDTNSLFTACFDSKVREFNYTTGELIHTYTGANPIFAMAISDKYVIFGGTSKVFNVFDRVTHKKLAILSLNNIRKRLNYAQLIDNNQRIVCVHGHIISVLKLVEQ
jgi:WD40 repeat protein